MNETNYFSPGETVNKDPQVKNTSSANESMFTGIRLRFYLKPGNAASYVQVNEDTFLEYVTILNSAKGVTPEVTDYNDTDWEEMVAADFNAGKKDDLAKYFKYVKDNGGVEGKVDQNTATEAIFQSVKPNGNILIPQSTDALSGRTIKFDKDTVEWPASASTATGYVANTAFKDMSDVQKRGFLAYVGNKLDTYYFDSFDFKIEVDGYGVKYDSEDESANSLADVIKTITDGLAKINPDTFPG